MSCGVGEDCGIARRRRFYCSLHLHIWSVFFSRAVAFDRVYLGWMVCVHGLYAWMDGWDWVAMETERIRHTYSTLIDWHYILDE